METMTVAQYAEHRQVSKNMIYRYIQDCAISDHSIIHGRPLKIDVSQADADLRRNIVSERDYGDDYDEESGDDFGINLDDVRLDVEASPGKSIIRPLLALILWEFSQIAERRGRFKGLAEYVVAGKWIDPLLSNPDVKRHMEWISRQIDRRHRR